MKYLLLSIDVEPDYNKDKSIMKYEHIKRNLVLFLDYLISKNIRATLFVTDKVLNDNKEVFKKYVKYFEFGCHVHVELDERHKSRKKIHLTQINKDEQLRIIKNSKRLIEDFTKQKVISFRASSHRISKDTLKILKKLGFKADSSYLSYVTNKDYRIKPYDVEGLREFPVTTYYKFPVVLRLFIFLRSKIMGKKPGISFTGFMLNKNYGYYMINYAIKNLFKECGVLSLYIHSYDLGESKVLYNINKLLSQHEKNYFVSSIQDFLKENDSFG